MTAISLGDSLSLLSLYRFVTASTSATHDVQAFIQHQNEYNTYCHHYDPDKRIRLMVKISA